jgi:hypothetical protein
MRSSIISTAKLAQDQPEMGFRRLFADAPFSTELEQQAPGGSDDDVM